ncbi:ATP-dependent RNA helicase [Sphingobium sp. SCG-1]|uniref:RcnB family protein n=1 Tax=Sphingobium sp. SCG-1 TaxID=2072936 RepID=UPI000CD698F5|nr:RcnB family protein [Sphingobium sp. SCG-1]AUW59234.1 ATP-dependent RNA helicase [Sphingobium sp. SCG-1]
MTIRTMMLAGLMTATALGAAVPAFAQQGDNNGWRGRGNGGEQRQQQRSEARAQIGGNAEGRNWRGRGDATAGAQVVRPQVAQQQQVAPQQRGDWQRDRRDARQDQRQDWQQNRQQQRDVTRDARNGDWGQRAEGRRDWRNDRNDRQDGRRDGPNQNWRDNRGGNDVRGDNRRYDDRNRNYSNGDYAVRRYDGRNRLDNRERWANQRRWDNGWRNDRRYDWQSYRRNYGQIYRPGRYYAPRGWNYGYRQYSVGIFLDSLLYSNNYWLDDPYRYRLPPAYGSMRWIRYYDDALLVDTRDGYVVDVINGFFY